MPTFFGDIHGQYDKMISILLADGLIDEAGKWCGGTRTLFFLGDYVDRGPDGIGLCGRDPQDYDLLLDRFSDRLAFWQSPERLRAFLQTYGGNCLIHGHTPIFYMKQDAPAAPFHYADGNCVNIDAGLYLDRAGFVYRTESFHF